MRRAATTILRHLRKEVSSVFSDEQKPPSSSSSRRHDPALKSVVDRMLDTTESQVDPAQLEIGDRVRHQTFGDGVIESLSGAGLSAKAKVHFTGKGPKVLLLSHARLEKL